MLECNCHCAGAVSDQCDNSGACTCKEQYTGEKCDQCKEGNYLVAGGDCDSCEGKLNKVLLKELCAIFINSLCHCKYCIFKIPFFITSLVI